MSAKPIVHQLVVIGAGPGGYAAAFRAADMGMRVTLIDPEANPGGVCLYRGCIPSKALLHVAKLLHETREAKKWGIDFGTPKIDPSALQGWKSDIVATLTGGLGQLTKQRNIEHIRGYAKFTGPNTLDVRDLNDGVQAIAFKNAIIATGSRPTEVPALQLESERVMNSTGALNLDRIPKSMLVVGGGYIGLELGSVYAALGSRVSVVEMLPSLLPGADADLVRVLHRNLEPRFDAIMLETTVERLREQKNGIKVTFSGKNAPDKEPIYGAVLVAVGRRPHTAGLGLEHAGVHVDRSGFIRVNEARQTSAPHVYAIGDVAGEPMLAHKATHEGRLAAEAISGASVVFEPQAIPAVVFTDPEVAWCGLTETAAREAGRQVEIARFPWGASGRARTLGGSDGLTKLVIDPKTERILGAGIVGPAAGELIGEATLAVEMGAVASDVGLTIHAHPTLSETIMEAADAFFGHATHIYRPRRQPRRTPKDA